jgi:FAD/FMN-containing dehydrogenase
MTETSLSHYTAHVPEAAVARLAASFRGELLRPGDAGYDDARTRWNAMIDRRPGLIARCRGEQDVAAVVGVAREHGILLSVRGGGHNIAGNAVCDGGIMLDLSLMRAVHIDPEARTARVDAGCTLADFDAAAQAHGLATPLGINSTTGVAGLTLGGGFGWLSRRLGLTVDNLRGARVVTADGAIQQASANENAELFWALRGGGGNFGVVTSFEYALHPVGPEVLSGLVIHPLAKGRDVLRFYREFAPSAPEALATWFVLRLAPPLPFLPEEWHGKPVVVLACCYAGDLAEGERVLAPLRGFGTPLADVIAPTPFAAWQTALDPLLTPGMRNYWKSHDFRELSDGLIDVLLDFAGRIPDPQTDIAFAQLGGAIGRVPPAATAYGHRDAEYAINVHGRWADPAKDVECIAWARQLFQACAPFSTGSVYVNFLTAEETDRVRVAFGPNYDRLVELKRRYDPTNLFRMNQNIPPGIPEPAMPAPA